MHHRPRNDDTFTRYAADADASEEIDGVSATTRASSIEDASGHPSHAVSLQEPCLLQCGSQHRRRPRSTSASDSNSLTPPLQAPLKSVRGGQNYAGENVERVEDTPLTAVTLSSITAVGGSSGSFNALDGTCVSSPLTTALDHSGTHVPTADDGQVHQAEGIPELSWNPHTRAHPLQSARQRSGVAKKEEGPGLRGQLGVEGQPPPASPHLSPRQMSPSGDHSYTTDIAATLAHLLCRYLPREPPSSSPVAAAAPGPLPTADVDGCTRFLTVRWGRRRREVATAAPPPSQPDKYRQLSTEARSWAGAPPSPRPCPPTRPQQTAAAPTINNHGACKKPRCSNSGDRTTNFYDTHNLRMPQEHEHLWKLLTHYPRDASACLALGLGVCAVLDVMRSAPPPVLPAAVLHDIATTTATEIHAFLHACEEAWQTAGGASVESMAALLPHVEGVEDATCQCGCLTAGHLLDPALYRFHLLYYLHHNRYPPFQRQDIVDGRVAESVGRDAQHDGERNALEEARAAAFRRPHAERQPLQHPRCATLAHPGRLCAPGSAPEHEASLNTAPTLPFGPPCARGTSPTVLLPLLALQTLSSFVGASSKRRSLAISRQRRRWRLREARRSGGCSSPTPVGSTAAASSDLQDIERAPMAKQSQTRKSRGSNREADQANYYSHFCDETERLWAVMASVLLAWKQLEQCVSLSVLVPRAEVIRSPVSRTRRREPQTPLARAAASMRPRRTAVEELLLHSSAHDTTTERAALARLRLRILSVVPKSRHTANSNVSDDVASSLRMMESFVYSELQGQLARLPLWCAVAVEVLHLYIEQLRHNHRLLEQGIQRSNGTATQGAVGRDDRAAWTSLHSSRTQQVVLLATRLMTLMCMFTDDASASASTAEKTESPPAPPCQTRRRHRTSPENYGARASRERGDSQPPPACDAQTALASAAATGASFGNVKVSLLLLATSVTQLSAVMYQHPLFGVAVAVVGGGVPLHWAEACVAPRAMNVRSLTTVPLPRPPAGSNSGGGNGVDAWSVTPIATVAAADAEAQAELRRLVQLLFKWLREATRRP
ncbi:hypothetical protein JKF63_07262 [Porcisia hertigi]|uniref:Uncharacterized protein n=1 Tax=Porcisia hertigi TaxID=2761500 RepID=A0A837A9F2_9TRYP|nr:hypothetical protein JKF63_07262 [Porcisia hertigi]